MAKIRIDKYLADAGFGSRKDVKGLLKAKQVTINGEMCVHAEEKLEPAQDVVCVQGKMVVYESFSYYMLHKPQGVVSATKDAHEKTVVNLITEQKRRDLFPVGRLDKDTEGLLLLTNDGKLSNDLLAPGKHVEKTYYARIKGMVTKKEVAAFAGFTPKIIPNMKIMIGKNTVDPNPINHCNTLNISSSLFLYRLFNS